jgi:hypothetical protein
MKKEFKGTPTTRMYPRSLDEAFPNDPARFQWFYPPEKNLSPANIIMGISALALWVLILFLLTAP